RHGPAEEKVHDRRSRPRRRLERGRALCPSEDVAATGRRRRKAMIAAVESGAGNLRSVAKALERAGGKPEVTADPDVVRRADRIVVPGQGAFRDCMLGL